MPKRYNPLPLIEEIVFAVQSSRIVVPVVMRSSQQSESARSESIVQAVIESLPDNRSNDAPNDAPDNAPKDKQVSPALHRSEHKLRQVLDSVDTFIGVVSKAGYLLEINQKALDIAALQSQDVVGKPLASTYWWAHSQTAQAKLQDAVAQANRGESVRYDEQLSVANQQLVTVDFSLVPVLGDLGQVDYLVASANDITQKAETLKALRASEKLNQAILSALPDLIARMDIDGNYLDIRTGNFPTVHLSEDEIGENIKALMPSEMAEKRLDMAAQALNTGEMQRHEFRTQSTEGETYWRETRIVPLGSREVLMSVRDFTKLHQTKAKLGKALQQEKTARQEAEKANQIKDEFLTILSHELRTPLNPILGWASLLLQGKLTPKRMFHAAEAIQRNGKRLIQLIDDLLDMARMLRGHIRLDTEIIYFQQVVVRALETVELAASSKSISIETQLDETIQVKGDDIKLQQVVWNLLSNAIKFTPSNGKINIQLYGSDQQAVLKIKDTGVGIAPDFLPHVFDRFRQENSSITRQFGGVGLGLSIVKRLTELHGGSVSVESAGENQGTTFIVQLPLMSQQLQPSIATQNSSCRENCLKNCQVWVVDDDPDSREILSVMLEERDAQVTSIVSGEACLMQLDQATPEIVICDIGMPDMDGYELLKRIRQRSAERGGQVKMVALTAYSGDQYKKQALAAGFQAYLAKPIDIDSMIGTLKSVICS